MFTKTVIVRLKFLSWGASCYVCDILLIPVCDILLIPVCDILQTCLKRLLTGLTNCDDRWSLNADQLQGKMHF